MAKVIRRIIEEKKKTALVVEHDLMLQNYISSSVIVFTGTPGINGHAFKPMSNKEGFNILLKELGITVRKDHQTGRPRVNKPGSYLDRQQKAMGQYYIQD